MVDTQKPPTQDGSHALPDTHRDLGSSIFQPVHESVKKMLPAGAFRTDDHRYYFNARGPVPGVTSVIDTLMKWDLVNWRTRHSALAARDLIRENAQLADPEYEKDLVRLAKERIDQERDKQAAIGTGVHLLADMETRLGASETASKAGLIPDEWIPYLEAYRRFSVAYRASETIVSSEKMVWSENGYGGTYDFILRWYCKVHSACLWLVDVKTAKGYYPENGLQLAAYRWADAVVLEGDPRPYPMPEIQHTALLHLRPDKYPDTGWRLIEYPTTYKQDYMAFLGVLEAYRWRQEGRFTRSNLEAVTIS